MRDRVRAIIPDFWHHMPSPETCGFQYIDDVPGYVWDVTGDVRKIEDYILPVTGQDRIACKHAALERMENDPITTAETSMQLTKFRRGMKPDAAAFRKVKKAVQHIELDDQKLFDGMDAAFSTQMIEYQTPEGDIVQAPHPRRRVLEAVASSVYLLLTLSLSALALQADLRWPDALTSAWRPRACSAVRTRCSSSRLTGVRL